MRAVVINYALEPWALPTLLSMLSANTACPCAKQRGSVGATQGRIRLMTGITPAFAHVVNILFSRNMFQETTLRNYRLLFLPTKTEYRQLRSVRASTNIVEMELLH